MCVNHPKVKLNRPYFSSPEEWQSWITDMENKVSAGDRYESQAQEALVDACFEALNKRIALLESALKPFADIGNKIPGNWPKECVLFWEKSYCSSKYFYINYHGAEDSKYMGPVIGDYVNAANVLGTYVEE